MKYQRTPKNIIDGYLQKAEKIKEDNRLNFRYKYWIRTPNGMFLDIPLNHQYGEEREGFELWKVDNPDLVARPTQISLREVRNRNDMHVVLGYVTEERKSDYNWHMEVSKIVDECFDELCKEINVVDKESFKIYVYGERSGFTDDYDEFSHKLHSMESVYDDYLNDPQLKKLIDKIKG